ncbi:EpsK domain protein [Rhodobacteraceae bacterium KLH11]|nr:EpsK domain protein [Rhodobacteraceae bacterium KLH11]
MAKIAYILLCHKDPDAIIAQAEQLTTTGDCMAIHFDARADEANYARIRNALKSNPNVTFAKKRVKCGWGEWSLVQATLHALQAAAEAFPRATHFYMLSGDCMAIKTAEYAHNFLDERDADFIESHDFFESDWIKTGMKEDRLIFRHYFNERNQSRLFYAAYEMQKRLRLTRDIPADLQIMIGSQWWCLRRRTVEMILDFLRQRRDVIRFFSTTWIPDETFFQTLVRHLIPKQEIENRTLTFLMFSDYGMPVTFYNDHYDMLLGQDYLFARKISPEAHELKERLGQLYASEGVAFPISDEGRNLYHFLTGRGRVGRRFARRFWEASNTLGPERQIFLVVCKKWHVAKRLVDQIASETSIPCVEYIYDEQDTPLPDLGGIETTLTKRSRHRRAVARMLFDHFDNDKLVLCLDPANLEVIQDFCADQAHTRVLEIECEYSDDYLTGHAQRVGLAGQSSPTEAIARLLPTLRNALAYESELIRDTKTDGSFYLRQTADQSENETAIAEFLGISADKAKAVMQLDYLFID